MGTLRQKRTKVRLAQDNSLLPRAAPLLAFPETGHHTQVELGQAFFYSFLESHVLTCSFPVMCLYSGRRGAAGMLSGHTEEEAALTRTMNARCQMNQLVLQRVLHVGY